jgi:hypothetical protein
MTTTKKHVACACPNRQTINSNTYPEFDKTVTDEIKNIIYADEIINKSLFCFSVPIGYLNNDAEDTVTIDDIFHRLKGKQGIYQLWVLENDYCDIHKVVSMRCLYTGKGLVVARAKKHILKKWPDMGNFYITFYECENRISKYLEQLFLDIYKCEMNKIENPGKKILFAHWTSERYQAGTETHSVAERYAVKLMTTK